MFTIILVYYSQLYLVLLISLKFIIENMQIQPSISLYDINEEKKYQQRIDQQEIDYNFLISLIQEYYPQYQAKEIQIMVQQKSDTKLYWKLVSKGFKHTFTKNCQHLNLRFMLNPHIIQQDNILTKKLQQTQKQYKYVSRILNKILNQPLDINIFWASPLYTLDQYQRKLFAKYYGNKNRCFIDNAKILVNQVKYFTYVGKIIQTIKKSKKRIKLKMDLFQKQCFKKKNYSIVYLICHTEISFDSSIRSLPEIQQKQQDSSETNSQRLPAQLTSLPNIKKNYTKYDNSQKSKFMNLNKAKSGDYIKYKQKPKPNLSKYFLGQSPEGKLIEIHPNQFYKMLEDRSIDLLVMHTSYPYYHLDPEELDKLKINNILLINSNPNLPDDSVLYFLQEFFQKLLQFGKINEAYQNVIEDVAKKFPQFQCCCYHQHLQNCTSNDLNIDKEKKLTQKFYSSHYRYHQVRCNCEHRFHNFHRCSGKRDILIKQNYSCKYKYKNSSANSQFFYCCCSQFNQHLHSLKRKFELFYSKESAADIKIKTDPGVLNENQSIKWIDTIIQQQRLIGNQNVILKLLDWFVGFQNSQNTQKIFNIYGGPKTGRKFIARYFANMLVHRKKDIYTKGWIQKPFQSIKQIKGGENTFFIYVKKRLSKKNTNKKSEEYDQLPINIHCIIVTYDKIQINNPRIKIPSAKSEILDVSDECPNYIKVKGNFNQEQKDKLKQYLKLTIKQQKKSQQAQNKKYYPYTFEKQQIYCILKQSIYNDISAKFLNSCTKVPIFDLVLLALCVKFSQKQAENELSKIIEKLRQQSNIQNQNFTYNSFFQYFPLIFQQFYTQISEICFDIMAIFIQKTNSSDQQQRLFEATSINKNSLLYQGIKKKIQQSQFLKNSNNRNLKKQKKQKIIDLQLLLSKMNIKKASLCFLRNCLLKHTIFLQLGHQNKILLIKLGILLVNNIIVAQKTQPIQQLLEKRPTLVQKKTSIENSLNEPEENNSSATLWLQNIDLVSRQGLLYLLNRMESHIPYDQRQQVARQALKIILQLLKLQIYLESKYEKQTLKQSVNETIQKLIQQIIQRLSRERQDTSIYTPYIDIEYIDNVEFDCAVALIILHTNGGRTSLSVNAEKQIIKQLSVLGNIFNFSNLKRVVSGEQMHQNRLVRNIRKGSLTENQSFGERGRKFFVMKLCEDTAMFNRILDKISSTASDENGRFNQLAIANQILDCLKLQKKCEPSSNPALCYDIIQNLCKKFKEINTDQFRSSYLSYLYQQLQEKIQATQKQLRLKTFIWMETNPTSSNQIPMVRNTIIQDFSKYSQEKRKLLCIKMKFNINNLKRIEQQKGCRFLCLNIEMPYNNQQHFIMQDQNGKTYSRNWKQIADIIKNIAVLNLFICLKKPKQFVQELLKYKQHVLYFNFLQLRDKKNQIKNLPAYYEKMIMIKIVRTIIQKMHFERQKIDEAVTNVLSTFQFVSDTKQIILSNEDLSKIVKKHNYGPSNIDKTSRKLQQLSHDDYYDSNEINRIKYIEELCFKEKKKNQNLKKPGQQITITFSFRKLVLGLIELFKIKHGFNKFIEIDFTQFTQKKQLQPPTLQSNNSSKSHSRSRHSQIQPEYQEHEASQNILDIIKDKKILQFFYNTKQGFLIASDFNEYQKICKKWQKQQYKRLFVNPHELGGIDSTIHSFQFKIKSGHEIHQLLICIIRE